MIVVGWEPGGGSQPECEATDPDVEESAFFYDADIGAKLGQWVVPRPQSSTENSTAASLRLDHFNPQTQAFSLR